MRKILSLFPIVAIVIVTTSCAQPPAPIPTVEDIFAPTFTALALTLRAQFSTQTAMATGALPGSTPQPTATYAAAIVPAPTAPKCANQAEFIADVNVSSGTTIKAGEPFVKTWRIKNVGTCSWNDRYMLVFASMGELLNAQLSHPFIAPGAAVLPGSMVDVSIPFQAPYTAGSYRSYWNLLDDSGEAIKIDNGYETRALLVEIIVEDLNAGQGTPNPTALLTVQFSPPELIFGAQCGPDATYMITASLNASGPATGSIQFFSGENGILEALDGAYEFTDAGVKAYTFMLSGPYTDPGNIAIYATLNGQASASLAIPCQ